jgi:hypothetical protein
MSRLELAGDYDTSSSDDEESTSIGSTATKASAKSKLKPSKTAISRVSVKWNKKRDSWAKPHQDVVSAKAASRFWEAQAAKWERFGSGIQNLQLLGLNQDLEQAFRYASLFANPQNRTRAFDEFFSIYRHWTPEIVSTQVRETGAATLVQLAIELNVGFYWTKILSDICFRFGPHAADAHKVFLLQSVNGLKQNIFHSLAKAMNSGSLLIQNEAIHLFRTMQTDSAWFAEPFPDTMGFGFGSGFGSGSLLLSSIESSLQAKQLSGQIKSSLSQALEMRDISGKRPEDLILNPYLKRVVWTKIESKPVVLRPISLSFGAWASPSQEELSPEIISQMKQLTMSK